MFLQPPKCFYTAIMFLLLDIKCQYNVSSAPQMFLYCYNVSVARSQCFFYCTKCFFGHKNVSKRVEMFLLPDQNVSFAA